MAKLFTCYSPKGEKFELTRLNFLDCTERYGFTTNAPAGDVSVEDQAANAAAARTAAAEAEAEAERVRAKEEAEAERIAEEAQAEADRIADEAAEDAEQAIADAEAEADAADENADEATDVITEDSFADMDRAEVKAWIEEAFPDEKFDGRLGQDDLVALAVKLSSAD